MTFAFDYIKHFPNIVLTGTIENSTKLKWDLRFKEYANGISQDVAIEAEKAVISDWPHHMLPPPCFYSNTCTHHAFAYTALVMSWAPSRIIGSQVESLRKRDERLGQYRFDFED